MNDKKEEVSVLFSGGSDSTLTAFKLCELFKKVHLLTYSHSYDEFVERSEVNVNKLKNMFGVDRVIHKIIDVDPLWEKIYRGTWKQDVKKYGSYIVACGCGACKLAMHTATIIYNLENNIRYAADGANQESMHRLPAQMKGVIAKFKEFYNEYGIIYDNPVYNEVRTDWKVYQLGLTNKRNTKFPHEYIFHETGPTCYNGSLHNIYVIFYYLPFHGKKAHEENSIRYCKEKRDVARAWIEDYFRKRGIDINILVNKIGNNCGAGH
jgi:7-cyano-7-deazaguanine synthase in queuosine biosynthesis